MPLIGSPPQSPSAPADPASPSSPFLPAARTVADIFPPVTKAHILNCSYPRWHSRYRAITPKTKIIPLTPEFISYVREDGIILPSDENQISSLSDSEDETEDEEEDNTPAQVTPDKRFPDLHQEIKNTIAALDGRVAPKLNWSSPKDAGFMTATNTLECRTPGEIYLLLKSSDFVTHDLEHAFDGCIDTPLLTGEEDVEISDISYSLVLRKWFQINPSMEFRCFIRDQKLLAITQRELNYFEFLHGMKDEILKEISKFFKEKLRDTFPDRSFVFDCYMTATQGSRCVWLIDINPFAPRTDPILFSWVEVLNMSTGEGVETEVRLVKPGDPESYSFNTPQYSTSKMPQEVVEAGLRGDEAVWEFANRWRDVMSKLDNNDTERANTACNS